MTKSEQSKGKDVILYNEFDYGLVSWHFVVASLENIF